tara:strand:- start:362 stop:1471 length:1110 start_codon:yes stop_codon:yes gene_type:complete
MTTPLISDIHELKNTFRFTLSNVNFSIANALRRTILVDIPCFVFKTSPYAESKCEITTNTGKLNNEIIKQRLSCIPIHLTDLTTNIDNYSLILQKKNETNNIIYVTTEDFQIYDNELKKFIDEKIVRKMFPPCPITNRYIDYIRLKPKISNNLDGEEIDLSCKFHIATAKESGMYNVVSTCAYGNTIDLEKSEKHWDIKEKELKKANTESSLLAMEKKNWNLLDCQRYFIADSFDFKIESIGIYKNQELVKKACEILINELKNFNFESNKIKIENSRSTIANSFDVTFIDQDYTLGKVLEYFMYNNYYEHEKTLTYCGFNKDHPHDNEILIRLGFKEEEKASIDNVKVLFNHIFQETIELFETIREQFK